MGAQSLCWFCHEAAHILGQSSNRSPQKLRYLFIRSIFWNEFWNIKWKHNFERISWNLAPECGACIYLLDVCFHPNWLNILRFQMIIYCLRVIKTPNDPSLSTFMLLEPYGVSSPPYLESNCGTRNPLPFDKNIITDKSQLKKELRD